MIPNSYKLTPQTPNTKCINLAKLAAVEGNKASTAPTGNCWAFCLIELLLAEILMTYYLTTNQENWSRTLRFFSNYNLPKVDRLNNKVATHGITLGIMIKVPHF